MVDATTALLGITPLLFFRIPQAMRTDTVKSGVWQDFRQGLQLLLANRGLLRL